MLTTGEILKNTREKNKLTIEDVEKSTKIRKKYLIGLENSNWLIFPSLTYIIGSIQTYSKFLNLDEKKLIAFFRREYDTREEIRFKTKLARDYFTPQTKKILIFILSIIFIIFLIYFMIQLYIYFKPPTITILAPKTSLIHQDKIKLVGQTQKETIIFINGKRVFLDKNNRFSVTISLVNQKTAITIEATGTNGQKTTIFKVFEKK